MKILSLLNDSHDQAPAASIGALLNPVVLGKRALVVEGSDSCELVMSSKRPCLRIAPLESPPSSPPASDCDSNSEISAARRSPPASPTTVVADRFALSRMVGQKHRQKEDVALDLLGLDVSNLQEKHSILGLSLKAVRDGQGLNGEELRQLRALLKAEVRRQHPALHRVSDATAVLLGRRYISGAMALLMLAQVATRRNLVDLPRTAEGSRRRRNTLECPPESVFGATLRSAIGSIRAEAVHIRRAEGVPEDAWVAAVLDWAVEVHQRWASVEDASAPPNVFTNPRTLAQVKSSIVRRRRRSVREDARPGDAKRCSRCKKDKTAGSGHPRSHCDDGLEVCSSVPYGGAVRPFTQPM